MAESFNNGLIPLGTAFGSSWEESVTLGLDMGGSESSVALVDYATQTTAAEIIPAPRNGGWIRILGWDLVAAGAMTVNLKDGSDTLGAAITFATGVPNVLAFNECGWFDMTPGQALNLVLSAATQLSGFIRYTTFGER